MQSAVYQVPIRSSIPVYTLVGAHILLAIAIYLFPQFASIYGSLFFLYGLLKIIQTGNKNNEAAYFAVYLACYEIIVRMSKYEVIYEFGKYTVTLVLLIGMLMERNPRKIPVRAILYFFLLIPAIFVRSYESFISFREHISFNLSGPLCLMASWLYFSGRKFTKIEFERLIFQMILPLVSLCIFIILRVPTNIDTSGFTNSTKAMSGGFGPNQVSSALGFGFFIASLSVLLRQNIFNSKIVQYVFPFAFLGFGILTFSRGGGYNRHIFFFIVLCYLYSIR